MFQQLKARVQQLTEIAASKGAENLLSQLPTLFPNQVCFSTSFSYEDQVITHLIATNKLAINIFTLDTGRLFAETYAAWEATNNKYKINIKAYYPLQALLQEFVSNNGPNSFYQSIENRKTCCHIRKVEPLQRALKNKSVWITGLRAEHAANRNELPLIEWDEANHIIKFHPLLHWSTSDVKQFITNKAIPFNSLHEKGFVSIGCAPCTRAIKPGEDFRAGRWWWETNTHKECGLHLHENPKLNKIENSNL